MVKLVSYYLYGVKASSGEIYRDFFFISSFIQKRPKLISSEEKPRFFRKHINTFFCTCMKVFSKMIRIFS